VRFPTLFARIYPATPGTPTLGSDATPSGPPTAGQDNVVAVNGVDSASSSPVRTIALAFTGPPTASLQAQLYVYENALGAWLKAGPAQTITPNALFFFDAIVPVGFVRGVGAAGAAFSPPVPVGSAPYCFIVGAGAGVAGVYEFAACPLIAPAS
jgi:hypothetical protein